MTNRDFPVYDICSLSEFGREDILISRFAPYLQVHQNLHLAHRHTFYHVVLFTEGAGNHTIDFQFFPVKPFQLYFMIPGQVHSWDFEGKVDGYVMNFSAAFFQSLLLKPDYLEQFSFFSGSVNDVVVNLPDGIKPKVLDLFEELIWESEGSRRLAMDMVRLLMLQFFVLIGRLGLEKRSAEVGSYNYTLLRNFQKLIEQHYTTLKLPKSYAELLFITPNHLNALCNSLLGMSAGELIRARITLEAKRLLINKGLSIAEIAQQLNFSDNSNFTKFYKKQTSLTPDEFRKEAFVQVQDEKHQAQVIITQNA